MSGQQQIVNELYDLEIPYYAMVDKAGMGQIVDAMGGVEINVHEEDIDILTADGYKVFERAGVQLANGAQAVAYMNSRETNGDTGKNDRQHAVLDAISHKLSGMGKLDVLGLGAKLLSLVETNVGFWDALNAGFSVLNHGYSLSGRLRTPEKWTNQTVNSYPVAVAEDMDTEVERVWAFLYSTEEEPA